MPDAAENLKVFDFDIQIQCSLTAEDIWPDGDGPDDPTAADVKGRIERLYPHRPNQWLKEWDLVGDVSIYVDDGDENLAVHL